MPLTVKIIAYSAVKRLTQRTNKKGERKKAI